jgi:hypothetical protein
MEQKKRLLLQPDTHYRKGVFVWMPGIAPRTKFLVIKGGLARCAPNALGSDAFCSEPTETPF